MLFGLFLGLSGFLATKDHGSKAIIDDFPFRLNYGFTCAILFLSSALVGIPELTGKNIDCIGSENHDAVNQYCWVTGTHVTVTGEYGKMELVWMQGMGRKKLDDEICERRPGLNGKYTWKTKDGRKCEQSHGYYQWIPYVLFLQGCLFYLPRMLWKSLEEGKLQSVSDEIRIGTTEDKEDKNKTYLKNITEKMSDVSTSVACYLKNHQAGHRRYGLGYFGAQLLCGLNILFVFWLTNLFLDHQFYNLGIVWARESSATAGSPTLRKIFPRVTQCVFESYGSGGRIQPRNYMCVLAPNIISEKIFVVLWFWFLILGIITWINIIILGLMVFKSANVRNVFLMKSVLTRKVSLKRREDSILQTTIQKMDFGQFLFLYLLGQNVEYQGITIQLYDDSMMVDLTLLPFISVFKQILDKLCEKSRYSSSRPSAPGFTEERREVDDATLQLKRRYFSKKDMADEELPMGEMKGEKSKTELNLDQS